MSQSFQEIQTRIKSHITLWVKRIYVIAFNIYVWYWLYREIFINESSEFEPYLLWFFTVAGMHFFVLDNQDLFFKSDRDNRKQASL